MSNEGLIIDLNVKPTGEHPTKIYEDTTGTKQIKVTRSPYPNTETYSNFYRYTHQASDEQTFTLLAVLDDGGGVIATGPNGEKVVSVSAYYWKDKPEKVLIVGIPTSANITRYYANTKDDNGRDEWTDLSDENLETYLDQQNCKHRSAVTLDLTKNTHGTGERYCCHYHDNPKYDNREGNVLVTSKKVSCQNSDHSPSSTSYFKHYIEGDYQLAKIKYYLNGAYEIDNDRKRIKSDGLSFPIKGPVGIYVFYCKGNDPKLIYVRGGKDVNGWYKKKDGGSNKDENWTQVDSLQDVKHMDLDGGSLECGQWNNLREVLKGFDGCGGLQKCTTPKEPAPGSDEYGINGSPSERDNSVTDREHASQPLTPFTSPKTTDESAPPEDSSWDLKKILGSIFGTGAPVGGGAYAGWQVYTKYFLDALVRLI